MEVEGKKVLVLGAARSGIAAARFLNVRGAIVALSDQKPFDKWTPEALGLKTEGITCLAGEVPDWLLRQLELVVLSPGVPKDAPGVQQAERAGAGIIGEIELAARFLRGRVVGITGTNGKTTTTTLIGELLKNARLPVQVGGNIGKPLISLVESSINEGWTVVELSSFQLETIKDFHPAVAVVLNVTPNHMDRYDSFAAYADAKRRIFMNQTAGDVAILNADDETVSLWEKDLRARVVKFSVKRELESGLFLRGNEIVSRTAEGETILLQREEIKLRGLHNVENVLASVAASLACGVASESMRETIRHFQPVEHRLEFVAEINQVKFYNDSKATSVDATAKALEAFADDAGKVVLILGGRGKNAPYAPLAGLIKRRVRKLILLGEDAETIARELGQFVSHELAVDLPDAVRRSLAASEQGDVVLLAPACASFDMFESFEHRGKVFKEAVASIKDSGQE